MIHCLLLLHEIVWPIKILFDAKKYYTTMKIKRQIILNLKEFTSSHCTRKLEISQNLIVYKCFSIEVSRKLTAI